MVVCLNLYLISRSLLLQCDKTFLWSLGRIQRHWKKQINLKFLSRSIVTLFFIGFLNDKIFVLYLTALTEAARLIETRYRFRRRKFLLNDVMWLSSLLPLRFADVAKRAIFCWREGECQKILFVARFFLVAFLLLFHSAYSCLLLQ